ncbi:Ca2+ regulator and membrane fusion protein Fig1-domain-containing protein [Parachaetomium inaequale]|uniref:Ca2+ regulator and membrane fusion protein Fig1-domain-containing protein n=1 Tax=Parachaetomium inaequale TaxID=2588326 RepID=A0AAN6P945_9PEZI|nr:Ca2+ regulator and membrane fusion protein Fig1-domain-containing protein [Parachaetomium inaequale]
MKEIYLLSFSYTGSESTVADDTITNPNVSTTVTGLAGNATALQIRVGYFGYCLISGGITSCSTDAASLAALVQGIGWRDSLNLLYVAKAFHNDTIFSGLIFISIIFGFVCFLLLGTFPNWHTETGDDGSEREVKPFPSRPVTQLALLLVSAASLFALVAALWQHLSGAATSTMAGTLMYGTVSGQVGAGAMALGWIATALLFVVMIGLLVMILSISVLAQLTNDD